MQVAKASTESNLSFGSSAVAVVNISSKRLVRRGTCVDSASPGFTGLIAINSPRISPTA